MWCTLDAHRTRWIPGPAGLCAPCLDRAATSVRALVRDYVDLEQVLPASGGTGEKVSGTRPRRIPISTIVEALQREIWYDLVLWESIARPAIRATPVTQLKTRDGYAVQRAAMFLAQHIETVAAIPTTPVTRADYYYEEISGAEALIRMETLHRRAGKYVGAVYALPGTCGGCGIDGALQREITDTHVRCGVCGTATSMDEYNRSIVECLPVGLVA